MFRDREIGGGTAMNSVEDLDVFKRAGSFSSGRSKWGAPADHFDVLRILKR